MELSRTPFKWDAEPNYVQEVGHTALAEGVVRGIVVAPMACHDSVGASDEHETSAEAADKNCG
jgi:hypothetical protein